MSIHGRVRRRISLGPTRAEWGRSAWKTGENRGQRLQREKKHDRKDFLARASSTDPEAHVMRNGEGGTMPSYNVQLLTDTTHGMVVNVEAATDAIDYRQLKPALERCATMLGQTPKQIVADGDYTNHASVQAAADCGSCRVPALLVQRMDRAKDVTSDFLRSEVRCKGRAKFHDMKRVPCAFPVNFLNRAQK